MGGFYEKLFNILKEKLAPLSSKLQSLKSILPQKKPHSEKYYKRIAFLNKYSLIFHFLLACLLILAVETISRRDFVSAITFISNHTLAFLYNALIIFASLSLVYLTKYRTQMRILISGLWIFLGTVNGLILSNRVTPFSYTDLKCLPDLFAMQNTNYFTAEEATMVVSVVVAFFVILGLLFAKGPRYQGKRHTVLGPVSIAALILIGLPITTQAAQSSNILASYFANIAQGYSDYGLCTVFPPVLSEEAWINRRIIPRKPLMRSTPLLIPPAARPLFPQAASQILSVFYWSPSVILTK